MDSKLSMQNQISSGDEVGENSYTQKKNRDPFILTMLWNLSKPAKSWIGIMRDLHHIDAKHMELQNELHDERKKETSQESWWAEATECYGYLRKCARPPSRWPDTFWTSVPFTIWKADFSVWCKSKNLSNNIRRPKSSASVRHKSHSWNNDGDTPRTRWRVGLVIYCW